jgi:hypothetical protein
VHSLETQTHERLKKFQAIRSLRRLLMAGKGDTLTRPIQVNEPDSARAFGIRAGHMVA